MTSAQVSRDVDPTSQAPRRWISDEKLTGWRTSSNQIGVSRGEALNLVKPISADGSISAEGGVNHVMTTCDARPAAPALDLAADRLSALTAENARLRAELRELNVVVDDLLDRESMFAGAACMERLTTAASIDRLGTPRACHLVTSAGEITAAAGFDATGIRA